MNKPDRSPPVRSPFVKRERNLQPLEEAERERMDELRRTILLGITKLWARRDEAIDARHGRGTGRAIGGTPSSTDLLGTSLRHEVCRVLIGIAAGIHAEIEPATIRDRNVHAFCDLFRRTVEVEVKSKRAKP